MFLTLNLPPRHAAAALADLPRLFAETGATHLAFIVRVRPETPPYLDQVSRGLEWFDRAAAVLKPAGVQCGVLIQTLIGHGERSSPVPSAPFQRMVGADGVALPFQYCPLDGDFLAHTAAACREIARHAPAFILLDDDVRMVSGPPLQYGCFCPLHLQRHATRTGEPFVQHETWLKTFLRDDDAGRTARTSWQATLDESLLELARLVRESIDTVDPAIRCGTCVVAGMRPLTERLTRTLAGGTRPLVRVGQAFYNEQGAKPFPLVMATIALQRDALPRDIETLSEADSYPQTQYSLSATALRAYIAGSLLQGIDAPDVWLSPTRNWSPDPGYRRMLAANRQFFRSIREIARTISWQGPVCLSTGHERVQAPWTSQTGQAVPPPRWAAVLGRMGIPFQCRTRIGMTPHPNETDNTVWLIDGIAAHGLKDEELEHLFAGRVLLDGQAAGILGSRGYADRMGVDVTADPELRCSYEQFEWPDPNDDDLAERHLITARRDPCAIRRLSPRHKAVLTPAWLMQTADFQHPAAGRVAPSLTFYENRRGGRVAVMAHVLSSFPELLFMSADRRRQIQATLDWLAGATRPAVVSDGDWYALYGTRPDGTRLLAVFNLSLDPVEELTIVTGSAGMPDLQRLNPNGAWEKVNARINGDKISLQTTLTTLDPCILLWR